MANTIPLQNPASQQTDSFCTGTGRHGHDSAGQHGTSAAGDRILRTNSTGCRLSSWGVTDIEDADNEPEPQERERNRENSRLQIKQENWESVKNEVLTIVSRRYLEPSLKRIEVVRDVSSMNHTLAGTFITQVGFYRLVNAFRIRHYERLMASDSSANIGQEAAAELCGFKNRWGLTNARKRLKDFDYDLIEKYVS